MANRFMPFKAHCLLASRLIPGSYPTRGGLKVEARINPGFVLVDNILSIAKKLMPEGAIEQDLQNVYISKVGLSLIPVQQNSLESIIAAILNHRILSVGKAGESRIKYEVIDERVSDGFIYTTIIEIFYQPVSENDYEIDDYDSRLNPNKFL